MERVELLRDLRLGTFDVLVGINLLREGLDLPEVSLVAILDADKEGFLRSGTSLIQTIGRAARNVSGQVIMYADQVTGSMQVAIDETNRRRHIQQEYNRAHGIDPQPLRKKISDITEMLAREEADTAQLLNRAKETPVRKLDPSRLAEDQLSALIEELTAQMKESAKNLEFEVAAQLRDEIAELKTELRQMVAATG